VEYLTLQRTRTVLHQIYLDYAASLFYALALHSALLAYLFTAKFAAPAPPATVIPVTTFLYQPADIAVQPPPADSQHVITEQPPVVSNVAEPEPSGRPAVEQAVADAEPALAGQAGSTHDAVSLPPSVAASVAEAVVAPTAASDRPSLAQRALNMAMANDVSNIDAAAQASYQRFKQAQQQPKITVEKRHQAISNDPAKQLVTKLDDGRHIIRTKQGCLISDPSKHGFDALMATGKVACGDEVTTSELLTQALDKHRKN
jgi:hypothetical protein